jgi:hypothetical protein
MKQIVTQIFDADFFPAIKLKSSNAHLKCGEYIDGLDQLKVQKCVFWAKINLFGLTSTNHK